MSEQIIIVILAVTCIVLIGIIIYQRFLFQRDISRKLREITAKLEEILNTDSEEKVMVFTDRRILTDLLGQINRLLLIRQKTTAGFKHTEETSRKMLANISHDIKTPMTVIMGYLEIMRLQNPEDETLSKVQKKAEQVMDLINQFFSLAKLEAGDTNLELTKINLNEICRENVLDFYELLTKNEFEVDIQIPDQEIYVSANKDAVNRILFNLISNVVRYGADGRYLGIHLYVSDAKVYIDVIDHGKGIEKDFAASVFDRLFTMEDSRNRKIQGNGLGLTIAKNLAEQMGGDLWLESVPDRKTVFTLQLIHLLS